MSRKKEDMKRYFVTGIGTDVGKTVVSAVLTESLKADYWKPVQAGDLDNTDSHKIERFTSFEPVIHPERHRLNSPMSPHAAARIDGVKIKLVDFELPKTDNNLIVEGAGGLMVPLNDDGDMLVDLIKHLNIPVILVSQNYLGSINHTLLSIELLQQKEITVAGIIINGEANAETEAIVGKYSNVPIIGRIGKEAEVDVDMIMKYANKIQL